MAAPGDTAARFPGFGRAGGYESWYLRAVRPGGGLGVWIRYTVHQRAGAAPVGSVWFTLFGADGPRASKVTLPDPHAGDDPWIEGGESSFGAGGASGAARTEACDAAWELRQTGTEQPLRHLPRDWMYRARLPRTKLLSPLPDASFDGRLSVDGEEIAVDDWRGMVGHNWGSQHAERWIWLHGLGFEGEGEGSWIDVALGRIKVGGLTTPWIANGALSLDGERHALGGVERARATRVDEAPDHCELVLPGRGVTVAGRVGAPRERFVGWVYADPDGSEHHTVNCSIADMTLTVERPERPPLTLRGAGVAAYELGMRERDHGMEIQPFPDG